MSTRLSLAWMFLAVCLWGAGLLLGWPGSLTVRLGSIPPVPADVTEAVSLRPVLTRTVSLPRGVSVLEVHGLLPVGARISGVTAQVVQPLGRTHGLENVLVGGIERESRWGVLEPGAGARTQPGGFQGPETPYAREGDVITLTAVGGRFDGIGTITIIVDVED